MVDITSVLGDDGQILNVSVCFNRESAGTMLWYKTLDRQIYRQDLGSLHFTLNGLNPFQNHDLKNNKHAIFSTKIIHIIPEPHPLNCSYGMHLRTKMESPYPSSGSKTTIKGGHSPLSIMLLHKFKDSASSFGITWTIAHTYNQ